MISSEDQGAARDWAVHSPVLSDRDFNRFSAFIYETCGIKLPPIKKTMLSARLQKRLRQLHL
ncbi:MAG: chemotaxis protein CheR, partial [Deltaproteobacteria bacterium]|nr:chemotaxis protein CheR [Deltaproteobacteria bacterium]